MNEYKLSEALGSVPDDLLLEATKVEKRSPVFRRVLRIAACLALVVGLTMAALGLRPTKDGVVTGSGSLIVTVRAFDSETNELVHDRLTADAFVNDSHYWPLTMSSMPGLPVHLLFDFDNDLYENITFKVSVNCGEYLMVETNADITSLGSDFVVDNDTLIFWKPQKDFYDNIDYDDVYTDIIICSGENIVGYAVLHFERIYSDEMKTLVSPELASNYNKDDNEPTNAYHMALLESVSFPIKDGKFQSITMEYVEECIKKVHK